MNWMRRKVADDRLRQGLHRQRLGQAGHAFEQHVAAGEQADQQPVDQVALADDDGPDLLAQAVEEGRAFLDAVVDGRDAGIHGEVSIAENGGS